MRQLSIALVLLVLVAIGTFYLITQQINLHRYLPAKGITVPVRPHYLAPRSPEPGPGALPGHVASPEPLRWRRVDSRTGDLHSRPRYGYSGRTPIPWPQATLAVATPVQITPLPVPTFASHTFPPPVHIPPPVLPDYQPLVPQANVTASPSDHSQHGR
jgi:hypothetical protein